jgi:hypothetical protein
MAFSPSLSPAPGETVGRRSPHFQHRPFITDDAERSGHALVRAGREKSFMLHLIDGFAGDDTIFSSAYLLGYAVKM